MRPRLRRFTDTLGGLGLTLAQAGASGVVSFRCSPVGDGYRTPSGAVALHYWCVDDAATRKAQETVPGAFVPYEMTRGLYHACRLAWPERCMDPGPAEEHAKRRVAAAREELARIGKGARFMSGDVFDMAANP
jgi:hypothetical protein